VKSKQIHVAYAASTLNVVLISLHSPDSGMVAYDQQSSPSLLSRASEFSEVLKTSATPLGLESSVYSYSSHSVLCPTEDSHWHLRDDVLPTIAGLNLESPARTTSSTSSTSSDSTATASDSTASSDASNTLDTSDDQGGLSGSAKIGLGIGIAAGIILLLILSWFFLRKRSQRNRERKEPRTISTLPAGEKAELQGGQFDESIAGPVFPRNELDPKSSTTVRRRPVPEQQQPHHHPNEPLRPELHDHTSSNAPWLHEVSGFAPPELHSAALFEANTEAVPRSKTHGSAVTGSDKGTASEVTPFSKATTVGEPVRAVDQNMADNQDAALAREADALVQELGLISTQKRNVSERDRGGQRYKEILERERSVRGRLEEIDAMTRS
jgi:hypothetical protein